MQGFVEFSELDEAAKTPAQRMDFKRMMAGAMSRKEYNENPLKQIDPNGWNLIQGDRPIAINFPDKYRAKSFHSGHGYGSETKVLHGSQVRRNAYLKHNPGVINYPEYSKGVAEGFSDSRLVNLPGGDRNRPIPSERKYSDEEKKKMYNDWVKSVADKKKKDQGVAEGNEKYPKKVDPTKKLDKTGVYKNLIKTVGEEVDLEEEKKITIKTKMGGEIPGTIKVTGKDYHIVKSDVGGKQYKTDHQGNALTEELDDKDLPFTPDKKKTKPSTPGKYGSAYSTVRNLARQAMAKQAKKNVKEKITVDEEVLDELDQSTLTSYVKKAKVDYASNRLKGNDDEAERRRSGIKTANKKLGEEALQEASDSHKVMVTVSDPNHTAVSQRKEQIMKHAIVRAGDKGEAQAKAEAFYKKKGYKVHGSEYHSKQPATSMKTEELKGDQHKLDVDKDGKIEKSDLEKLRSRKTKNEEYEMKTFSQFMEEIEQIEEAKKDDYWDFKDLKDEPKSTTRKIAGKAYGGAAQKDDDDEDHPVANKATEKRGRGRPKGSTSGARTGGAAKKSYGGMTFHSLNLPNSNK